jgi:hypothetical protein
MYASFTFPDPEPITIKLILNIKVKMFDCTKDNPLWYNVEDHLTEIINSK